MIVRAADVRDIEMTSGGPTPGPPVRVDTISLATRVTGAAVRVDRLAVRGPAFTADVSGTLEPRGDYPLDLATAWSVQANGTRYEGRGTLAGTLESLRVTQRLLSPAPLEVEATLLRPLRDLGFSGDVRFDSLDLRLLVPSAPAASASGSVHAEGALERFTTRGEVRLETRVADVGRPTPPGTPSGEATSGASRGSTSGCRRGPRPGSAAPCERRRRVPRSTSRPNGRASSGR